MQKPRTLILTLLALLIFSLAAGACSTGSVPATATSVPKSSFSAEEIHQLFDEWHEPYGPAGVVLGVQASDGDPWIESRGFADPESTVPMSTGDRFLSGAITVMFVATIVMQLAEEGVLNLDESLDTYVPEIQNSTSITIEQLLRHESGVGTIFDEEFARTTLDDSTRVWTRDEILEIASSREPLFEPGSDFQYSTLNYYLLGRIIEQATGSSFLAALNQRILDPLNLEDTFMAGDEEIVGGLTIAYVDTDDDGMNEAFDEASQMARSTAFWTSGAIVSTARDLLRFSEALFGGELLEADSLDAMMSVNRPDAPYGIGLFVFDQRALGATAWGNPSAAFYSAWLARIPEQGLTVLAWGNTTIETDVPAFRDNPQGHPLIDLIRNVVNVTK